MKQDTAAENTNEKSGRPLFLERNSFRSRRLQDAARLLPYLSVMLVLLPIWWAPEILKGASGQIWFFVVWAALVLAIFLLHRAITRAQHAAEAAAINRAPEDPVKTVVAPTDAL